METSPSNPDAPAPRRNASRWGVLRHAHFRNVWIAAFISSVGGWMEVVGVQWAMTQAAHTPEWIASKRPDAAVMMGYLAVAQMGPQLFLGLIGGIAADRFNRKKLLLIAQVARMLIAGALCVFAFRGTLSPTLILVLGACDGVAMAFGIPAWQVLTPRLVPREDLVDAITLNGLQFNLARALGPALGGVLLGVSNTWVLFCINTLSFCAVLVSIFMTPDAPAPQEAKGTSPAAQLWEAARFTWSHRGTRNLILGIVIFSMLATPLLRMLPILVKRVYLPGAAEHVQESLYGMLLGVMGAGAVAGALTIRRIPAWYPKHHFVPLSILVCALALVWFSAMERTIWAGAAIFVTGIFWMWAFNAAFAALQLLVPDSMRGRVLAICNTLSFGFMPVGALCAGWIATLVSGKSDDGMGVQVALGSLSIALVLFAVVTLTWRTPEIDGIQPGDARYDKTPGLLRGITGSAHRARAGQ